MSFSLATVMPAVELLRVAGHSTPGALPATRAGRRAYLDDVRCALTTQ
jgi:hypothetical protein